MQDRILYCCTDCAENFSESCGHYDRNDLRVFSDGRWLCEVCWGELKPNRADPAAPHPMWSAFPPPPEYGPLPAPPVKGEEK